MIYLLNDSDIIAYSLTSYIQTIALILTSALVTQIPPPVGQTITLIIATFLTFLVLSNLFYNRQKQRQFQDSPKLPLNKLSTSPTERSHSTGVERTLSTQPPKLSRTNSSQYLNK